MSTQMLSEVVDESQEQEDDFPYRILSKGAVVSVTLALMSIAGYLFPGLLILAAIGFLAGLVAYSKIRRYPQEFSGKPLAVVGALLNGMIFVSGVAYHAYDYATEVPEGHERIAFTDLQPDHPNGPAVPPASAFKLNGKNVFIKGYMYPDGQLNNIKRFVLIPDLGTCCFGGQPKLTNMVQVTLRDPIHLDFERTKRKLAGKFNVDDRLKPVNGLGGVYYELDASFAK